MSITALPSSPSLSASAMHSAAAAMWTPQSSWLTVFIAAPSPWLRPTWRSLSPSRKRKSAARSNTTFGPPAMIVSVPASAPTTPPETGASRKAMPISASFSPMAFTRSGGQVAMRTTSLPRPSARAAPSANRTCSAWSALTTISSSASAPSAATDAVWQGTPPAAASSASDAGLMSKPRTTVPGMPSRRRAMGRPMAPRPTKASVVTPSPRRSSR